MSKVYAIISDGEYVEGFCNTPEEAKSWIGNSDGYRIEEVSNRCSRCEGCDLVEITDGKFYCSTCEVPCDEIRKCPWSL